MPDSSVVVGCKDACTVPERSVPPKPRLAFRVGVLGHRPDRLGHANLAELRRTIGGILDAVQAAVTEFGAKNSDLFEPSEAARPALRAISPLAEGSDRILAEEALERGWELCCVMPFRQSEYEADFEPGKALEPDSLTRFRGILDRAKQKAGLSCFQLDGSRTSSSSAYGTGGQVVLNQSDLLVVVWDGRLLGKSGGTEETMDMAGRSGIPVLWVDAHSPHACQWITDKAALRRGGDSRAAADGSATPQSIADTVTNALDVPQPAVDHEKPHEQEALRHLPLHDLRRFFADARPERTSAVLWSVFKRVLGDSKLPTLGFRVPPFEAAVLDDWPRDRRTPVAAMVDTLRPFYAWTDKLSALYADRYRSAFLAAYLMAAFAVAMALTPVAGQFSDSCLGDRVSVMLELFATLAVLALVVVGRRCQWHERWIDYRLAAELLRHLRVVAPVGGGRPFRQVPAHHVTYGRPQSTWMDWYVRAITRSIGLPDTVIDRPYLTVSLAHIGDLLAKQAAYHHLNARRCRVIEHRLHLGVMGLLVLTIVACTLHWQHLLLPAHVLTFFCGLLPALGAALAAISNQGEFRRVARRSEAMSIELADLRKRVSRLGKDMEAGREASFMRAVLELSSESTRILVQEVLDWRVVFLDRPLEP